MSYCQTLTFILLFLLSACSIPQYSGHRAPVREAWSQPYTTIGIHVAAPGETLKSIAWRYGKTEQQLIQWNDLKQPYTITTGEKLFIKPPAGLPKSISHNNEPIPSLDPTSKHTLLEITPEPSSRNKIKKVMPTSADKKEAIPDTDATKIHFEWPLHGTVIGNFGSDGGKGINIATTAGTPVHAAAGGEVVYAGDHLHGYGQLLIIRHNGTLLSAYAHNQKLLVHEGESVSAGQIIAEAGKTDATRIMLHFEIREKGKPVNPMKYLEQ